MSLSEAVRIWHLNQTGVRLPPLTSKASNTTVGLVVNVLKHKEDKALLKRGRKVTWVKNLKLSHTQCLGGDTFVTVPPEVALRLI